MLWHNIQRKEKKEYLSHMGVREIESEGPGAISLLQSSLARSSRNGKGNLQR